MSQAIKKTMATRARHPITPPIIAPMGGGGGSVDVDEGTGVELDVEEAEVAGEVRSMKMVEA